MGFNDVLQDLVNSSDEEKLGIAFEAYKNLKPALIILDPRNNGLFLTSAIFGVAIAQDGNLNSAEAAMMSAFLMTEGINASMDEITEMCVKSADPEIYTLVRDLAQALPVSARSDLITLVAAICSIDDRISRDELRFLNDLMD
ncbi:MAG: hypothetical protein IJH43_00470 [Mogibacterium sp.]|nr:hypothetical protein [Mogibacterium sp.]